MAVAALGSCTPAPLVVLELGLAPAPDSGQAVVDLAARAACALLAGPGAALSVEQGLYTASHAYMQRVLAEGQLGDIPAVQAVRAVCRGGAAAFCTLVIIIWIRVSPYTIIIIIIWLGSMRAGSLARQQGFLGAICGGEGGCGAGLLRWALRLAPVWVHCDHVLAGAGLCHMLGPAACLA